MAQQLWICIAQPHKTSHTTVFQDVFNQNMSFPFIMPKSYKDDRCFGKGFTRQYINQSITVPVHNRPDLPNDTTIRWEPELPDEEPQKFLVPGGEIVQVIVLPGSSVTIKWTLNMEAVDFPDEYVIDMVGKFTTSFLQWISFVNIHFSLFKYMYRV